MIENVVFLIPARRNSKGFKFKNRKLIDFTLNSIPKEYLSMVYISTDDEELKLKSKKTNINIIDRPVELAQDETTMKEVLQHFIEVENITNDTDLVILANPNSPMGEYKSFDEIRILLEQDVPVLIDEAYIEFSDSDSIIIEINNY